MLEGSAEGIKYEEFIGLLHSGLRQTQVIVNHIEQMQNSYGAKKRNFAAEKQLTDDVYDAILRFEALFLSANKNNFFLVAQCTMTH